MDKNYDKTKPLRALLLSAGFGTRLKPITNKIPKCLVEINNKPILEHWLTKLEEINCEKVLINSHYLHSQVNEYLLNRKKSAMIIELKYEKQLLGTAGTLLNNYKFFENSKILMIHVDNMTDFDISSFIDFDDQKRDKCVLSMLTFKTNKPSSCGIVVTDKNMVLRQFYEKSNNPPTNIANCAIYIFQDDFINLLLKDFPYVKDFSTEVIPNYLGKIMTFYTDKEFIDIGSPESLKLARQTFKV